MADRWWAAPSRALSIARPRSKLIRALPDPWPDLLDDCCDETIDNRPADFAAVLRRLNSASALTKPAKKLTNSIGMTLIRIAPGSFQMGTTKGQIDQLLRLIPASKRESFGAEQPQHPTQLTRPLFLGMYPVTQCQYQAIMGSNPSDFKESDDLRGKTFPGWTRSISATR